MGACRCPKYLYVRGDRLRISANTRSWEQAREAAVVYADQHDPACIAQPTIAPSEPAYLTLALAVDKFLAARRSVSGAKTTANLKSECIQLLSYVSSYNRTQPATGKIYRPDQITTGFLTEWMATWKGRTKRDPRGETTTACTLWTKQKKRKHINMFFKHCLGQGWIEKNPVEGMPKISKRNQPSAIPKIPFTHEQMKAILEASKTYGSDLRWSSASTKERARCAHAMVGLMRSSGLSILDATILERSRLSPANRLELYRAKTGEPVYLLLESTLAEELRRLQRLSPDARYFFWNGIGSAASAAHAWGNVMRKIFVAAGIVLQDRYGNPLTPTSHFFRNTFAKEMLETGEVSIDQLAVLMGDNPATIREHYFKWMPGLQNVLDDAVRASWAARGRKRRDAAGPDGSSPHAAVAAETPAHTT